MIDNFRNADNFGFVYSLVRSCLTTLKTVVSRKLISVFETWYSNLIVGWQLLILCKKTLNFIYLFIFNFFIVDKFYFNLQLVSIISTSTNNSKTCLKPLVQSTILGNVGIVDTRHLRQNLSLWCKLKSTLIKTEMLKEGNMHPTGK